MSFGLPRLVASTLSHDCYRSLKEAILNLDLEPGTPLVEATIAAQFGISKTPVREALAQLAGEGLVVTRPGRKSYVAGLSSESVREIYQVRLMLEPSVIRHVTPRLTDDDLAYLGELIERAAASLERDDRNEFATVSKRFHTFLIEQSKNRCLINIASGLLDQAGRMRVAIYKTERAAAHHELSIRGVDNHRRILDALIARDADRAAAMMAADLQMFLDHYESPVTQAALARLGYRD